MSSLPISMDTRNAISSLALGPGHTPCAALGNTSLLDAVIALLTHRLAHVDALLSQRARNLTQIPLDLSP